MAFSCLGGSIQAEYSILDEEYGRDTGDPPNGLVRPSSSLLHQSTEGRRDRTEDDEIIKEIPSFVPSFEGLRGLAVIMVLRSHLGGRLGILYLARGGVTIFFVLSGFLITGILLRHQERNVMRSTWWKRNYSHLRQFYFDRFVRLYPALLAMIVATTLLWYYWTGGNMPALAYQEVLVTLTYMTDVRFLFTRSTSLYLNTWSLSVEEKYYVLWSLMLPPITRLSKKGQRTVIYGLILISFTHRMAWYLINQPQETLLLGKFAPTSHIWKMLLGSSLRLLPTSRWLKRPSAAWLGLLIGTLPILLNLSGSRVDTRSWSFPPRDDLSAEALFEPIAALAAVLIICGSINGNWFLELHPIRFIGRISYAVYLYQVPLLRIVGSKNYAVNYGYEGFASTCFCILCGCVSTVYLEEPLRKKYRDWKQHKTMGSS